MASLKEMCGKQGLEITINGKVFHTRSIDVEDFGEVEKQFGLRKESLEANSLGLCRLLLARILYDAGLMDELGEKATQREKEAYLRDYLPTGDFILAMKTIGEDAGRQFGIRSPDPVDRPEAESPDPQPLTPEG